MYKKRAYYISGLVVIVIILIILINGCVQNQTKELPQLKAVHQNFSVINKTPAENNTRLGEQIKKQQSHLENNTLSEKLESEIGSNSILGNIKGPGYAELVDVSDGVAGWLSRDIVIKVFNASNPESPNIFGTINTPGFAQIVYKDGQYLYVGDTKELLIIPSTDPLSDPIGRYKLEDFQPSALTVQDNYAFLLSGNQLMILNVIDPKSPVKVSQLHLTGNAPTDIYIQNGYAYIVESLGGLNIVDVRDPKSPVKIKVIPFESHTVGFKIRNNYAYLGYVASIEPAENSVGYKTTSVFEVIDISIPQSPKVISSIRIPTDIRGLDISGNYAYAIGSYPYRIIPIDIRSPISPKIMDIKEIIAGVADLQDIVVSDGYLFIADGQSGLRIVDIRAISNPIHVKDINLQGRGFKIHQSKNILYIAVEQYYFNLANVSNPKKPVLTFSEQFNSSYLYTSIILRNLTAYFKADEFKIYNLKDPTNPKKINQKSIPVDSIQVQGNYLYSTIGEIGFLVYDISNPSLPTSVSRTPFAIGIPRDLSVDGKWAVGISNKPYSITLLDISDPQKALVKDSYIFENYPNRVTVKSDHVYVARGKDGIDIFKIASNSLQRIRNFKTNGYVHSITLSGRRAFLIRDGVDILDISNPTEPIFLSHINSNGEASKVVVDNNYAYIADGYAGLTIAQIPNKE